MDELEAIEAELKECLQELDNDDLLSAGNDEGADIKEAFDGMKTEFDGVASVGDHTFQPESEKVLQWRAAFQKRVEEKDAEEEKTKAVWRKTAEKDLEEFYKCQANSIRTNISDKKNEEATSLESSRRGECLCVIEPAKLTNLSELIALYLKSQNGEFVPRRLAF